MGGGVHEHEGDDRERATAAGRAAAREVAPLAPEVQRAVAEGRADGLRAEGVVALQRAAGNAGVARWLGREEDEEAGDTAGAAGGRVRSPVHDVVGSGGGAPLAPGVRSEMEARFGEDFSGVRVHTDGRAGASAAAVGASAYTVGDDVVFAAGRFDPADGEGRRTLAHELTHVVQQRRGPVEGTPAPGGIQLSDPGDRFEREAEEVARAVTRTGPAPTPALTPAPADATEAPGPAPVAQRQEEGEEEDEEDVAP